jgi:hypothetical protein
VKRIANPIALCALLALPALAGAATVQRKHFANCTALHGTYPHGVGRRGAHDHTRSGTNPVTDFTRNTKVYEQNSGLDRDHDGIACEKH